MMTTKLQFVMTLMLVSVVSLEAGCPPDHHTCRNPDHCVAHSNLCTVDQSFGSTTGDPNHRCYDPLYCKRGHCNKFECGRQCVPFALVCNGIQECFDGTDENYCGSVSECRNLLNSSTGSFSSLAIVGQPSGTCSTLISVPPNQVIWLLFRQMRTQFLRDLIKVYDGPNAQSPLLLSHSGRLSLQYSLRSNRNYLYVEYPSYQQARFVFNAFYTTVEDNKLPFIPGCGGYVVDNGRITVQNQFINDQCIWYVENRKKNHTILLSNTYPLRSPFASHSMTVRDGWSANGAIITTQESVQSIYSVSDKIRVSFKLNANIPALYSWIVSEISTPECWSNFTASTGTIKTANYPSLYDNLVDCRWNIRVEPTLKVRLLFAHVQTEKDHDFVYVYDGASVNSRVLMQRSGDLALPTDVVSSTNEMLVRFTSDRSGTFSGFLAVYSSI